MLVVFGLSTTTLVWFVGCLAVGLLIYFSYGFRFSRPQDVVRDQRRGRAAGHPLPAQEAREVDAAAFG